LCRRLSHRFNRNRCRRSARRSSGRDGLEGEARELWFREGQGRCGVRQPPRRLHPDRCRREQGQLAKYVGLTPDEAGKVRDEYSKAVAQRCQPPPTLDFEEYDDPADATKRIVAINVWQSLNLVGVKIETNKDKEGWGGPAFAYPVRSGTDATFLQPVQLPMYITAQVRRIVVMLSRRIPNGATVQLIETRLDNSKIDNAYTFNGVDEEANLVRFQTRTGTPASLHVPLDRILTCTRGLTRRGVWCRILR
jgi:hypothetical protein